MAIVVEEGKKQTNILGALGWIGFLVVIAVAVYYIFFAAPQLVVIPASSNGLSAIAPIVTLNLNPETVIQSPQFESLTSKINPLPVATGPASVGRPNPFIAP